MTSLSFLRQMLQDVRHQKVRTLLTLFGITWGTVAVSLLVAFGEGLEKRIRKNQAGLGENIVIAWPSRTSIPYQGLGKGRRIRLTEDDIELLRREIPEGSFSGEMERDKSAFRRERVRLTPDMSATSPIFAVMRNIIPAAGGRYVNDLDINRRRRVVFLGDKLKQDLFGEADAVGRTVMIDNTPFLVIGVMETKAQDSSYSGRDKDKAFMPEATFRGLFGERYVSNIIFQARERSLTPMVTQRVYEVLSRRHQFDPKDKEALGMWDTTEAEKFFSVFFGTFRAFLGIIGSFTLIVGGIGVSNIMYVVVEERTREIGIKLAVGAKPRFIQGQFLIETLTLTAIGGALGFLFTLSVMWVFPFTGLDEFVGTPEASPLVLLVTITLLGLIGFVAGFFPARRASLLDPVVALKLS
jgi:putative ABC transport system permease protein